MSKIGIITIVNVNNYGAELQAFALQHQFTLMGQQAEVINYVFGISPHHDFNGETLTIPLSFKIRIKRKILPYIETIIDAFFPKKKKIRECKFNDFHKKYNRLTSNIYYSVKSLYDGSLNYDIYCVGSDQVWNYQKGYSILPFLLDFVPKGKKKIAFASSIGLSSLSVEANDIFKYYLSDFDALAVRESQASDLLSKLLHRKIDVVLDPTLLLTKKEWQKVADYNLCPKERYLLLYIVTIKPCKYAIELAERIAKNKGLKIVRLFRSAATYGSKSSMINLPEAGPSDFVGLIENADFVVTNSFHGTVFSINFQIPFYSIIQTGKNTNSRLQSVLEKLKMQDRLLPIGKTFPKESSWICSFADSAIALNEERIKSIAILSESIKLSSKS